MLIYYNDCQLPHWVSGHVRLFCSRKQPAVVPENFLCCSRHLSIVTPLQKSLYQDFFSDAKLTIHRYISSKDSTVSSTWPAVLYTRIRISPVSVFNLKLSLHFCDPLNSVFFSRLVSSSSDFINPKKGKPSSLKVCLTRNSILKRGEMISS